MNLACRNALALALVGALFPQISGQTQQNALHLPSGYELTWLKVFPGVKLYSLSFRQSRLVTFNLQGDILEDVDLLEGRPRDGRYYFFDFDVAPDGRLYALATWRTGRQLTESGAFVYGPDGDFERVVVFEGGVEGRKIIVAPDALFVLGLTPDFYRGQVKTLHLIHRYDLEGNRTGDLLEVNWRDYLANGEKRTADVYRNLRPLVDRLPAGIDERLGIYGVIPGSHVLETYDPVTLQRRQQIHLQPPPFERLELPDRVRRRVGDSEGTRERHILKIQVNRDNLLAEFEQVQRFPGPKARVTARVLALYSRQGGAPLESRRLTPEDGLLVPQAGVHSEQVYSFSNLAGVARLRIAAASGLND